MLTKPPAAPSSPISSPRRTAVGSKRPLARGARCRKLRAAAETVAAEGWKWVDARADLPYGFDRAFQRLAGEPVDLSPDEEKELATLTTEQAELTAQYEDADEVPDEVDQRFTEIEDAIARLENRPLRFAPADMARAGAFVSIDGEGELRVERGYVKPEDRMLPWAPRRRRPRSRWLRRRPFLPMAKIPPHS